MPTLNTFDDNSIRKIAHTVTRLKAQQENLHKQVRNLDTRADQNFLQTRTGRTSTTAAVPAYPEEGCQFPFTVADLEFDDTITGSCPSTTPIPWTTEHVGRSITGEVIPEGSDIVFVEIPSRAGHRYWIWPSASAQQDLKLLIARENLQPGEQKKKFAFAKYDDVTDKWIDDETDLVGLQLVYDDQYHACVAGGEMVWCKPRPFDATHNPNGLNWDVIESVGLKRRVKIVADIAPTESGPARVWLDFARTDCTGFETTPLMEITVCNKGLGYHRRLFGEGQNNAAAQDFIWVEYDRFHWYPVRDVRPTEARAIAAAFCGDSSVTIGDLQYTDWANADGTFDFDISTADNSNLVLTGDGNIRLNWAEISAADKSLAWEITESEHEDFDIVSDMLQDNQQDCPELNKQKIRVHLMKNTSCPIFPPETVIAFVEATVDKAIRFDATTCSFYATESTICVPKAAVDAEERRLNFGGKFDVVSAVARFSVGDPITECRIDISKTEMCSVTTPTPAQVQPDPIVLVKRPNVENVRDEADGLYQDVGEQFTLCANLPAEALVVPYQQCKTDDAAETWD